MGDPSGSPDNFSRGNHQLPRAPPPEAHLQLAARLALAVCAGTAGGGRGGAPGSLALQRREGPPSVTLLGAESCAQGPHERRAVSSPGSSTFVKFLLRATCTWQEIANFLPAHFFTLLAASKWSLLGQSSLWAEAWKALALKAKLAQATGATAGSLVGASEEATATAWGEGACQSPELAGFTQSRPRYTTHLTSS